jgi:HK97 family phage portal protein
MLSNKYIVKIHKQMIKKTLRFFQREKSLKEEKSSRFSTLLSYQRVGAPLWPTHDFEDQVSTGYQKNAMVYRCITLIMRSLSAVPVILYKDNKKVDAHPLLKVLGQPNPLQNYASFFESLVAYLLLSGNSFIEAVALCEESTSPIELYVLRPDRISIIPGPKGFPMGYEYTLGAQKKRVHIDRATGQSPMMHIKLFNPLDDHRGMSPLMAARPHIDLQNFIVNHNLALLQNAGCPSGALIVKGDPLTPIQYQELRNELSHIQGKGAGSMLLLDGNMDWQGFGLSPKDMAFEEGRSMSARDIAQVFGIPPLCVGILGDSAYSNYQEARLHLWEDTLLPLLELLLGHLNQWLTPFFGQGLVLSYSKDDIHALIPRREKLWEHIDRVGCLTINEKRTILGYQPLQGGDVLAEGSERNALLGEDIQ